MNVPFSRWGQYSLVSNFPSTVVAGRGGEGGAIYTKGDIILSGGTFCGGTLYILTTFQIRTISRSVEIRYIGVLLTSESYRASESSLLSPTYYRSPTYYIRVLFIIPRLRMCSEVYGSLLVRLFACFFVCV